MILHNNNSNKLIETSGMIAEILERWHQYGGQTHTMRHTLKHYMAQCKRTVLQITARITVLATREFAFYALNSSMSFFIHNFHQLTFIWGGTGSGNF